MQKDKKEPLLQVEPELKLSEGRDLKSGRFLKGRKSEKKGKTLDEIYGAITATIIRNAISSNTKGKPNKKLSEVFKSNPIYKEISIKNLGEWAKKGHTSPNKGKTFNESWRKNLSQARMGVAPWNKGIKAPQISKGKSGIPRPDMIGNKINLGRPSKRKGTKMSSEQKAILKEGHNNDVTRQKHRDARLNIIYPKKDTTIERIPQNQLKELNIDFETHKKIKGQPDIYIPSLNLCIFCDGCYHHACMDCYDLTKTKFHMSPTMKMEYDKDITYFLINNGYNVLRLWAHDIKRKDFRIEKYLDKFMGV